MMLLSAIKSRKNVAEVALVTRNRELQGRLRAGFKGDKRFAFCALDCSLAKFVSQFAPGSGPAVLIADLDNDLASAMATIEALWRNRFEGAIVTISDALDEASVRALLQLRVADWLPLSASADEVSDACQRALAANAAPGRSVQSTCVAFVPAAGGVGNTTLSIQSAFLLAQRSRKVESTCLVDLNFQPGALADYLDLKPGLKLEAMAGAPERLDHQLLQVMLSRHESGIALLAAPRSQTECPQVDAGLVGKLLGVTSEQFDIMVVDMPPVWMPWTNDVLAGSDRVFVVTEFTVPALRKAHELVVAIRARLGESIPVGVIVNKWRRQLFGAGLRKGDASELLGQALAGFLPEDFALVRDAIDRGLPLHVARRSNRLDRELARILQAG
jgi:pilus assembly protein CpaE